MDDFIKILLAATPNVDYENEKHLIDTGIIDSLDIVCIISELSDAYDIEIPSEEIKPENFNSAEAMKALIDRLIED
jgi:D-alanine--poly(phosphoribitol) ligase subunit 2